MRHMQAEPHTADLLLKLCVTPRFRDHSVLVCSEFLKFNASCAAMEALSYVKPEGHRAVRSSCFLIKKPTSKAIAGNSQTSGLRSSLQNLPDKTGISASDSQPLPHSKRP